VNATEREAWQRSMYRDLVKALAEAGRHLESIPAEGGDERDTEPLAAFHLGTAGGIAFSARLPGVEHPALFDDISDAAEDRDLDRVDRIRLSVRARLSAEHLPDPRASGENALEWATGFLHMLAALNEARTAWSEGDEFRRSLMLGFLAGLMHWNPVRRYRGGSLRDAVIAAHARDQQDARRWVEADAIRVEEWRDESAATDARALLLRWVGGRLAAGHRLSGPMFFRSTSETDEERREREARERGYFEREETSVERAQHFGRRIAGGDGQGISVPTSYAVNRALVLQSHQGEDPMDDGGEP